MISLLDKLQAISAQPISQDEKVAACRRAILIEKLEHAMRVAEIIQRDSKSVPWDAKWELDIEIRVFQ